MKDRWKIILLGISIRLIVAPFTAHPWDLKVWNDVGYRTLILAENVYLESSLPEWFWGYFAYPPGWIPWCAISYLFSFNINLQVLVLKIPIIIADGLLSYALFLSLRNKLNERSALQGMALYLLNPLPILIGAVWGMFDAIPTLLTLASIVCLENRRNILSALCLGLGAVFKIYPALLFPFYCWFIWRKQNGSMRQVIIYALTIGAVFALSSMPFLIASPDAYFSSMLIHTAPSGWLTYWFVLSRLSAAIKVIAPFVFPVLLLILYGFIIRHESRLSQDPRSILNSGTLMVLLAFYVTSPKVNVQYLIWAMPFLIYELLIHRDRYKAAFFAGISILGTLLVIFILPLNQFMIIGWKTTASTAVIMTAAAGIVATSILVPLLTADHLFKLLFSRGILARINLRRASIVFVALSLVIVALMPIPTAIKASENDIVVAVPESPASGFDLMREDLGVESFLRKFHAHIVALALGIDFVNTYRGLEPERAVTKYFRVRYYDEWTERELLRLIEALKHKGTRVLLAIELQIPSTHGTNSISSDWLMKRHPEVLAGSDIDLSSHLVKDEEFGIHSGDRYFEYLGERLTQILADFGFDGVMLQEVTLADPMPKGQGTILPIQHISQAIRGKGKMLIIEDPAKNFLADYGEILSLVDFMVIRTLPWANLFHGRMQQSLDYFESYIITLKEKLEESQRSKLLYCLELMDEDEGWVVPALYLKNEVKTFEAQNLAGFVIIYANKYSPASILI